VARRRDASSIARFKQLSREIGRRLKLKPSDSHVQHIATLSLGREMLTVEMLEGARVDPTALLKFDNAIRQHMPAVEQPPVELVIVSRCEEQTCPACQHKFAVQKVGESLEQRVAKARLEQSLQSSSPASKEGRGRKAPQIEPTVTPSRPRAIPPKKADADPAPYFESMQRDTRPEAVNGHCGSLVWWTGQQR
jgi:hypothetical protein